MIEASHRRRGGVLLAAMLIASCDSQDAGPVAVEDASVPLDAGASRDATLEQTSDVGPTRDAAFVDAAQFDPELPLAERPVRDLFSCGVERPFKTLGVRSASVALVSVGVTAALAYYGGTSGTDLLLARLASDGTLGAPSLLRSGSATIFGGLHGAQSKDRLSLFWTEISDLDPHNRIWLAQADSSLSLLRPAQRLAIQSSEEMGPRVIETDRGYALSYSVVGGEPQLLQLDEAGEPIGSPQAIATVPTAGDGTATTVHALARTSRGFVVAYSQAFASGESRSLLQALDESGRRIGEAAMLSMGSYGLPILIARGDEVFTAVDVPSGAGSQKSSALRIARFRADGAPAGSAYELQRAAPGVANLASTWVDLGPDVGLFWSEAAIEPGCSVNCLRVRSARFVALVRSDLTPRGPVLDLTTSVGAGPSIQAATVLGARVLMISSVARDAGAEELVASTLRCER